MRIAVVHTDLRIYWPARLAKLQELLRRQGDELCVIELAGDGTLYDFADAADKTQLNWAVLFPEGKLNELSARLVAGALERKLSELNPDVVLTGGIAFTSGAASVRWARRNRRPVIVMDDVRAQDVPRPWHVDMVKKCLYRNVDALLIPAQSHAPSYERWGVPAERLFFGVDVVDNEWFAKQTQQARINAASRSRELPGRFFLGVGRMIPKKNWALCLNAYARYRSQAGDGAWGLVKVGDGPERAVRE